MDRRHRLRHRLDIAAVRQEQKSWRHPLAILLMRRTDHSVSRFAFVASRRIGNAVQRNRAKRMLREAVRLHIHECEPGWDCLFILRQAAPNATLKEAETAVLSLWRRAGIYQFQIVSVSVPPTVSPQ